MTEGHVKGIGTTSRTRRVRRQTLGMGVHSTPTESMLEDSYEQIRRSDAGTLSAGGWDVALITHHVGHAPTCHEFRIRAQPLMSVVGRHANASLSVDSDESLSLRHALCLLSRSKNGDVVTRVIDLSSSGGVLTGDEREHKSLATTGSVALMLGNTSLFVIYRSDFWGRSLPSFSEICWQVPQPPQTREALEQELRERAQAKRAKSAAVTLVGVPEDPWRVSSPPAGAAKSASLIFGLGRRRQELKVSAERLRAGCLIGRDPRCHINCEDATFTNAISRLHCLLIELDGQPTLFDIASTNGLYLDGHPQQLVTLSPFKPTTVELARSEQDLTFVPPLSGNA